MSLFSLSLNSRIISFKFAGSNLFQGINLLRRVIRYKKSLVIRVLYYYYWFIIIILWNSFPQNKIKNDLSVIKLT